MSIDKTAKNRNNYKHDLLYYKSARNAFRNILSELHKKGNFTLFLPGYIGFSAYEGSGIYDPVTETNTKHVFYKMDKNLNVVTDDLFKKIEMASNKCVVLLVHYFGYPDKSSYAISEFCKKHDAILIEDAAHALYTDYIDHSCGHFGDYVLYSLHKMLPFEDGGMMRINNNLGLNLVPDFNGDPYGVFNYDLLEIACKRKRLAKKWYELLKNVDGIDILRPYIDVVTPQTFPIIIKRHDRNDVYFKLNESGYGAVSLYHTMIEPIQDGKLDDALWLSQHITNMPVHQDVDEAELDKMFEKLIEIINE